MDSTTNLICSDTVNCLYYAFICNNKCSIEKVVSICPRGNQAQASRPNIMGSNEFNKNQSERSYLFKEERYIVMIIKHEVSLFNTFLHKNE